MEKLAEYIAFDLELNTVAGKSHTIQISAVKFKGGHEVDSFDAYVYTDISPQSLINGLAGITSEKIANAPKFDEVLADFKTLVGETALVGCNVLKSDLSLLAENKLDLTELYKVDLYDETFERRSTDLNGIANLKSTSVAKFLGTSGHGRNSLEDARIATLIHEKFMEFDENRFYLSQQEEEHGDNPFAALGDFFS